VARRRRPSSPRTLPAPATRCAGCCGSQLKDGTVIGLSDHDVDINFDIGSGSVRYRADPGLIMSDVVQTATFDSDNFEASVPIGTLVTLAS
jgi:hypothetical protein